MLRLMFLFLRAFLHTLAGRIRRGPLRASWSFRFEWLIRGLRLDWDDMAGWPAFRTREELEKRRAPRSQVARVERRTEAIGGVSGVWFEPPEAIEGSLVYLHGGSYLFGSSSTHADMIARMALATKLSTFAPDYRLAPEHPHPAQLEDALAVIRALPTPRDRLVLAGESAGGNLVLATLIAMRDAGDPMPAAAAVFSPWADLTGSRPSMESNDPFDYGSKAMLIGQAKQFAGGIPLDDPRISPLYADLHGLCPLRIHAGEAELLFDECRELAERARAAGVEVTFDPLPDMPHAAELLASFTPAGAEAIARAGEWLTRAALHRSRAGSGPSSPA